jgi:hypothetical protein
VVGVSLEAFLTQLQGRGRVRRRRDAEQITAPQLAIPTANPVEALFLLLMLGERVLSERLPRTARRSGQNRVATLSKHPKSPAPSGGRALDLGDGGLVAVLNHLRCVDDHLLSACLDRRQLCTGIGNQSAHSRRELGVAAGGYRGGSLWPHDDHGLGLAGRLQ